MGKKARSLLKISAIYFGTVLGAGFASGGELFLFFVRFQNRGIMGVLTAGVLFCVLGGLVLFRAHALPDKTPRSYLETIFGNGLAKFISAVMEIFLAASFCVMLSGAGAFCAARFSLSPWVGILVTDLLCLLFFMYDLQGLSAVNLLLVPLMLVGMLFVCLPEAREGAAVVWTGKGASDWRFLPYALFYVGYNMLTGTAVLVPASALAPDRKTAAWGGVLGGAALFVVSLVCSLALSAHTEVLGDALPLLTLSARAGGGAYRLYSAVLYAAMLTTAVSTGFSVTESLSRRGMGRKKAAVFVCAAAVPLSLVPFSVLMEFLYVWFGALGVLLIGGILWGRHRPN